jgi:hypothetical protein
VEERPFRAASERQLRNWASAPVSPGLKAISPRSLNAALKHRSSTFARAAYEGEKSRDQRMVPASDWLVARINSRFQGGKVSKLRPQHSETLQPPSCPYPETLKLCLYAVLLGRTVKSRTWVRMLDICIPFSCETNGNNSAMN